VKKTAAPKIATRENTNSTIVKATKIFS
jgi:hypothetical protein